jgi:hypothetical protein
VPQSPAFFVPALAIAFRLTCYYYRGAYYKAFERGHLRALSLARRRYRGETALRCSESAPLHALRALFLLLCPWWEGLSAFFRDGRFGVESEL